PSPEREGGSSPRVSLHQIAAAGQDEQAAALEVMRAAPDAELEALEAHWPFWARPDQLPPEGVWRTWLFLGGRGAGKARAGAEWVRGEVEGGRRRRIALVG